MQAGGLRRVADGFSADPKWAVTFDAFEREMDEAGHKVGEGWDGCAVCKKFAADLPNLVVQMMQQQQAEGQQAPPPEA